MAPLFLPRYHKGRKGGNDMQIILPAVGILVLAVLAYLGWTLMREE